MNEKINKDHRKQQIRRKRLIYNTCQRMINNDSNDNDDNDDNNNNNNKEEDLKSMKR